MTIQLEKHCIIVFLPTHSLTTPTVLPNLVLMRVLDLCYGGCACGFRARTSDNATIDDVDEI